MARVSCSFCGKGEDEVPHLVRGPRRVAICAECIDICVAVNETASPYDGDVLLTGIGHLVTNDRFVEGTLGAIPDGAVAIRKGTVRWAGPEQALPIKYRDLTELHCEGRLVVPGFVDAHGPPIAPGDDPAATWHAQLSRGTTTVAAVAKPTDVRKTMEAGTEALPEVGVLADGWAGPLPLGAVRTVGEPGRQVDWVRLPDDADVMSAIAASERTDPRGYIADRFEGQSETALAATRRAVVAVPTGWSAGGKLGPLWGRATVGLGSGGVARYGRNDSMALAIWLAVRDLGLRIDEALWSATRGSAIAMDWAERGHIVRGAVGDAVVLDTDHLDDLVGLDWRAWKVFRAGIAV